jgi:hypothetical protein
MRSVTGVRRRAAGALSGAASGRWVAVAVEWTCSGGDVEGADVDEVCPEWVGMGAVGGERDEK